MLIIHRISQKQLVTTGASPLTRESVIGIARRINDGLAGVVRIIVTADYDDDELGGDIEIATIELIAARNGDWSLQYVSHPLQSAGLTKAISPCSSDFFAFIQMHKMIGLPQMLTPLCARELVDEGLGPLASLNLRTGNSAPLVPSMADLAQLMALKDSLRMP